MAFVEPDALQRAKQGAAAPPAPGAVPAPPRAPSALQQALTMAKGVDAAADARMASNPIMSKILGQVDLLGADYAAAAAPIQARSAEIAKLAAQPDPERIPVPRLEPLAPPPTLEEVATKRGVKPEDFENPMRVFGQFMPVLTALAAGLIAKDGTAAINAATAAMNAIRAGDKEAYDRSHKEWLEKTKATTDANQQLVQNYRLAMEDRSASMAERMSKMQVLMAQNKDAIGLAALRGGYLDQLMKLVDMRDQAGKPIMDMLELTMEDQRARDQQKLREAAFAADMYFKQNPPLTSQDEVKAALAKKVMLGQPLTKQEEEAKQMLMDFADRSPSNFGGGNPYGGGVPAAPAAAPAAPATSAGPAASPEAPPVSMLKEGFVTPFFDKAGNSKGKWTLRGGKAVRVE